MPGTLIKSTIAVLAFAGLSACATGMRPTIQTIDRTALERAQSYAFLSEEAFMQSSPLLPGFPVDEAEAEIRDAIEVEMAEAGYQRVDHSDGPDMLVGYMINVTSIEEQYVDIYQGRFGAVRSIYVTDYDYIEGSLVIDLFETETGKRIWSGWVAKDFVAPPGNQRGEIITEAVDAILSSLSDGE